MPQGGKRASELSGVFSSKDINPVRPGTPLQPHLTITTSLEVSSSKCTLGVRASIYEIWEGHTSVHCVAWWSWGSPFKNYKLNFSLNGFGFTVSDLGFPIDFVSYPLFICLFPSPEAA